MKGNFGDFGDYEQCINIDDSTNSGLNGRYCVVRIHMPLPKNGSVNLSETSLSGTHLEILNELHHFFKYEPVNHGICLPSNCGQSDLEILIEQLMSTMNLPIMIELKSCDIKEAKIWGKLLFREKVSM